MSINPFWPKEIDLELYMEYPDLREIVDAECAFPSAYAKVFEQHYHYDNNNSSSNQGVASVEQKMKARRLSQSSSSHKKNEPYTLDLDLYYTRPDLRDEIMRQTIAASTAAATVEEEDNSLEEHEVDEEASTAFRHEDLSKASTSTPIAMAASKGHNTHRLRAKL